MSTTSKVGGQNKKEIQIELTFEEVEYGNGGIAYISLVNDEEVKNWFPRFFVVSLFAKGVVGQSSCCNRLVANRNSHEIRLIPLMPEKKKM